MTKDKQIIDGVELKEGKRQWFHPDHFPLLIPITQSQAMELAAKDKENGMYEIYRDGNKPPTIKLREDDK